MMVYLYTRSFQSLFHTVDTHFFYHNNMIISVDLYENELPIVFGFGITNRNSARRLHINKEYKIEKIKTMKPTFTKSNICCAIDIIIGKLIHEL